MKSSMKDIKRIKNENGETLYVYKGVKIWRIKRGNSVSFKIDGVRGSYCLLSTAKYFINKKIQGGL